MCENITACTADKRTYAEDIFTAQGMNNLNPIAIGKDGFILYGPYDGNGNLWQPCDVDVCNGLWINGQYAYVSTSFHPYLIGCFGRGSNSSYAQ